MTTDHCDLDHDLVHARGVRRRALLKGGVFAGGGLVAGIGGMLALNRLRGLVPHSITENDLLIGDERLREAIELTNSTNRGTGTQRLIWSVPTNEKVMSLTFDDGPDPQFTPAVLEVLDRLEVKANFNIMGHNAERHDGLLAEVTGAGHEIGNHTLTHKDLAFQTREGTRREVESAKSVIDGLSGRTTTLFRPPRGVLTGEAANVSARLGYDVLLWTAMIARPPGTRPSVIRDYAATRFGTGHILALHDGIGAATFDRRSPLGRELTEKREAEIKVLPAIIEAALDDDYRFVTVSDLMSTGEQPGPGSHVPG